MAAGGTQTELDALDVVIKSSPRLSTAHEALGTVEQLVIQYAAQMTVDVKVTDEVFNALRQHFDTTQTVELTSAIATYNMVARFLVALGVSPEVSRTKGCVSGVERGVHPGASKSLVPQKPCPA